MAKEMNELEKQIAEKNSMLDGLSHGSRSDKEQIHMIKLELDYLLYMYYKSLKCKCANLLVCWQESR